MRKWEQYTQNATDLVCMEASNQGFTLIPTNHVKCAVLTAIQGLINTLGSLLYSPLCVKSQKCFYRWPVSPHSYGSFQISSTRKVLLQVKMPAVCFFLEHSSFSAGKHQLANAQQAKSYSWMQHFTGGRLVRLHLCTGNQNSAKKGLHKLLMHCR